MNTICAATRLHPVRQPSSSPLTATSHPLPTTRLVRNYSVFSLSPLSSSSAPRETGHLTLFYSILHSRLKDVFRWPGSLLQTLHATLLNFLVPFTVFFNIPFLSGGLGGPHRFGVRLRLCPLSMWLCFLRQTIKIIEMLYIVVVYLIL